MTYQSPLISTNGEDMGTITQERTQDVFYTKIMHLLMTYNRLGLFDEWVVDYTFSHQYQLKNQIELAWIDHVTRESMLRSDSD